MNVPSGAFAIMLYAAATLAAPPLEFKGFQLGGTAAQLKDRFPFLDCTIGDDRCVYILTSCRVTDRCARDLDDDFKIGEAPINWMTGLHADRIVWITVMTGFTHFPALETALRAKFGKPADQGREIVQNAMGAKFVNRTMVWERPDGKIFLLERSADLTRSALTYATPEGGKLLGAGIERAAARAPRGL